MAFGIQAAEGFYVFNGNVYAAGNQSYNQQNDARIATALVMSLIKQNDRARGEVDTWSQASAAASGRAHYVVSAVVLNTMTDPWFWLSMHLMTRPTYFGGVSRGCCDGGCSCCSSSNLSCSGGGGNGDACAAILLIAAIAALVVAFVAAIGLTASHGSDAEKARKAVDEIKQMRREDQDPEVKSIFNRVLHQQRLQWASHSLKTCFTAIGAGGVGLLTASAIIALYAVINGSPISSYASLLATYGGIAVGGCIGGHIIRAILLEINKRRDLHILRALFLDAMALGSAHPYSILAAQNQSQATLLINDKLYIKNGENFSEASSSQINNYPSYTHYSLQDRTHPAESESPEYTNPPAASPEYTNPPAFNPEYTNPPRFNPEFHNDH